MLAGTPHPSSAQETPDSLRAELARLTALVDSLRAEVDRLHAAGEEEEARSALERLRAAAQAAAAAGGAPSTQPEEQEFQGRQRSLQALNPEISVNADMVGHWNKDDAQEDNFAARAFEISLVSNLDPFSRAKIFLARHTDAGTFMPFGDAHAHAHEGEGEDAHGAGFAVEEGYVEWVNVGGGVGLKLGRFFQQFGQLNRWHSHALPFQTRSLPHLAFIGEESLAQTGLSMHWLAPFGGAAGTYEATFEVTKKENELLWGDAADGLSFLAHLNSFWQLSNSTDLDLGLSWTGGRYETEEDYLSRNLYNAELAFTWRPPQQARYRGFQLRGGMMVLDGLAGHEEHEDEHGEEHADEEHEDEHEEEHGEEHELGERARGFWSFAEVRLSPSWLIGARFDWTENPADPDETAWLFSPTLTWWQSEYVRIRAEYDLLGRSFEAAREGRFVIQVTFAMGPHKHATY
jgi:hypothetical protein